MFIIIATNWYAAEQADNCVIIPSFLWATNEYLDIHRHNDNSTPYLRINTRGNQGTGFNAKVTDVGVYARIYGVIAK